MFRRFDQSTFLAKIIASLSDFISKRRGLPILIGIAMVVISFVFQLVEVYAESKILQLAGVIVQHVGILLALAGLLLAEAIGK